ncbi:uncharacterized protein LOC143079164 [Mytilus galloprovincialis]|uniref:uncharacterized protein LOC143079164 n=1 Tax=Mytilus galloprovincialis TaxID=29158 RepID=UPI003F7B3B54
MGSGGSRKATPTVLKGYRREISNVSLMKVRQKKVVRIDEGGVETTSNTTNAKVAVSSTSKMENDLSTSSEEKTETEDMEALKPVLEMEEGETNAKGETQVEGDTKTEGDTQAEGDTKTVHDSDLIKTIYCATSSERPLRNFGKIDYNVNAYHGGRTALYFVSTTSNYNNTQLSLVRSGYDGNHVQIELLSKISSSVSNEDQSFNYQVDEEGMLIAHCYYDSNHIMLLTNDSNYGNLRNGVFVEIQENKSSVEFPLNVNGGRIERGSGITLILCSGGKGDDSINTLYLILSETDGNKFSAKAISGEDKYEFSVNDVGILCVSGPAGSRFGLWHNRDNLTPTPALTLHPFVSQTQCIDGKEAFLLMENVTEHAAIVILCSNSNGMEDSTVSSVYHVVITDGNLVATIAISGCHGTNYKKSDLWNFEVVGGRLLASGPTGPCRYGVLSNIATSKEELKKSCKQDFCLATGESTKTKGDIEVTLEEIKGHVNKPSEICIMLDHKIIQLIPIDELSQQNESYSFKYIWKEDEREEGHYLVRVFAIRPHVRSGDDVYIELSDSPRSLIRQKPGVIYALNVASPVYKDMNGIVYSSEFSLFANFDPTFEMGTQCKAAGLPKNRANLPASILKTDDGFLYARARRAEQYNEFDHRFTYKVDDLPNGTFKLRLHLTQPTFHLEVNGYDVNDEVNQKINDIMEASGNLKSNTAYSVDINVEITENCLLIQSRSGSDVYKNSDYMYAFALLDNSYTDKTISESQLKEEDQEKHKLADKALPMNIAVTRKEMTVVGWSPNLLKNASGENKDMKHWNVSGDIRVCDASGYGTEACFRTSFMWSEKYQEVNLLDHLTAEYLDSAPDIQVSEWYKQGHCSGGFYCFTAQLMSDDGQVIKEYTTGELGSLTNSDWTEASVTFSGYGPGVRIVTFSSKGKDDKYWQGYFGPYISAAGIRVKKESKPAKNDSFSDIDRTDVTTKRSSLEKMVTNILTSNQSMFEDLVDDKNLPVDQEFEKQTDMSNELHGWKGGKKQTHKKREIRVFVSSTFRDFTLEREAIIKKAFREINRLCVDRGVFFTYVDLRWGITTEQTNDGKTIAICLQEASIDYCYMVTIISKCNQLVYFYKRYVKL